MKVSKVERRNNAITLYQCLIYGNCNKIAVVVQRYKNSTKVQFKAMVGFTESPVVIAESNSHGIEGCFMEFLEFIKSGSQKTYYEDGFDAFIKENYRFRITYKDGLVFILENLN